ncbi:MAG: hypothetical protein R3308_03620 [Thiohalobacterales bacterium]|nr:hypothetical protein [Thiohalobacterales bacterium]
MVSSRNLNVDPGVIRNTRCDRNYACLADDGGCQVQPFVDRDVPLLICRQERGCAYRKKYQRWFICTCPVNIASYSLN